VQFYQLQQTHQAPHRDTERARDDGPDRIRNRSRQGLRMRKERTAGSGVERKISRALIRQEEAIAGDDGDQADDERVDTGGAGDGRERDRNERGGRLPADDETYGKTEQRQYDDE
jgi:hypothetical protein